MRKDLRRHLAALTAVGVAGALLFANVAAAQPDTHGDRGAGLAAAVLGAPRSASENSGAVETTRTAVPARTAVPDACPRGLSAAQLDRAAQQLASQTGSRSGSQVAPNSNCCPYCSPPTTQPPAPPITCTLRTDYPRIEGDEIYEHARVQCTRPVISIGLYLDLYKGWPLQSLYWHTGGNVSNQAAYDRSLSATCVTDTYQGSAMADITLGPGYDPEVISISNETPPIFIQC